METRLVFDLCRATTNFYTLIDFEGKLNWLNAKWSALKSSDQNHSNQTIRDRQTDFLAVTLRWQNEISHSSSQEIFVQFSETHCGNRRGGAKGDKWALFLQWRTDEAHEPCSLRLIPADTQLLSVHWCSRHQLLVVSGTLWYIDLVPTSRVSLTESILCP